MRREQEDEDEPGQEDRAGDLGASPSAADSRGQGLRGDRDEVERLRGRRVGHDKGPAVRVDSRQPVGPPRGELIDRDQRGNAVRAGRQAAHPIAAGPVGPRHVEARIAP